MGHIDRMSIFHKLKVHKLHVIENLEPSSFATHFLLSGKSVHGLFLCSFVHNLCQNKYFLNDGSQNVGILSSHKE